MYEYAGDVTILYRHKGARKPIDRHSQELEGMYEIYVYVCMRMYVYAYVCMCVFMHARTQECPQNHRWSFVGAERYVCYVCVCMYVCMYLCMYIC
jgi:hypothetical protein